MLNLLFGVDMKKILVIIFFILGSGFTFSQNFATDNGAMILGGTAWFTSTGYEGADSRTTGFSINPVLDYFIMPNVFIGGTVGLYLSSSSASDYSRFGIGPEIGYAFGEPKSYMFPFVKAGFEYWSSTSKFTNSSISQSSNGTTITLGGGLVFEIVKHFGIVGTLTYNIMNDKYGSNTEKSNSIDLSFGIYGLIYK